ncbi:MAG: biopolymer transporter ExbD [Planctomycetia bacterium]|nr:biopolymer transporter ExbD [Planctomycetia bacterium]
MPKKRKTQEVSAADMTPMIDMVFQLLIFFMILINFSQADQNQRVKLPSSNLAKPPEQPIKNSITVQVAPDMNGKDYVILLGANTIRKPEELTPFLKDEVDMVRARSGGSKTVKDMTIIIRSDKNAKTGFVQEIIQVCQTNGLEKFALRAQYEEGS